MKAGDHADQAAGIGKKDDALMKLEILPGVTLDLLVAEGLLKSVHARVQPGQAGVRDLCRGEAGRKAFEVLPEKEQLKDVLFGELDDKSAALRENLYQSLLLQPVHGFPDRGSADPQGSGQLHFVQFFPGRNPALQDQPLQSLVSLNS